MKLKTLSEKVRGPYEKCSAVSLKARLMLICEWAESLIVEVVVVTNIERSTRIWIPSEQKLATRVAAQCVVIRPQPQECKARKLIRRSERKDVRIKGSSAVIVSDKPALRVIERETERIDRLVLAAEIQIELPSAARIQS